MSSPEIQNKKTELCDKGLITKGKNDTYTYPRHWSKKNLYNRIKSHENQELIEVYDKFYLFACMYVHSDPLSFINPNR